MPKNEDWMTPLEDARAYVKKLEFQSTLHPILGAVVLLGSVWWLDLGKAGTPFIVVGGLILALWREVLDCRAQLARISMIWMKSKGRQFYNRDDE